MGEKIAVYQPILGAVGLGYVETIWTCSRAVGLGYVETVWTCTSCSLVSENVLWSSSESLSFQIHLLFHSELLNNQLHS